MHDTPINWVVTVPAVLSEAAQAETRSCAEKAGMGSGDALQLISEPELAAVYALKTLQHIRWKIGDIFVVVDAGGGTVDLISYKITQVQPFIRVSEAAPGEGRLCGSVFIDKLFERKIRQDLGDDPAWDAQVERDAMDYFVTQV